MRKIQRKMKEKDRQEREQKLFNEKSKNKPPLSLEEA